MRLPTLKSADMSIKTVLWDVDATLLQHILPERIAIGKCFEDFGFGKCTDEMLDAYPAINRKWWDRLQSGEKTLHELTVGRFEEFLGMFNLDVSKAVLFNDAYMKRLGDTVCFVPDAQKVLAELKRRGIRQYIVTNGMVVAQKNKIEKSGISSFVDGVFISEEVGYDKPDVRFFEYVFSRANLTDRSEIMIAGDSLSTDMQGGHNAGIVCCWFNENHNEAKVPFKIDYEITDLVEVLDIVKE